MIQSSEMHLRAGNNRPALSIRQPFAEQILRGIKRWEYRSVPTSRRGRVYLYASRSVCRDRCEWELIDRQVGQVPTGHIVGSVEIIDCQWCPERQCYCWRLARPRRICPRRPENRPQPVWFYPFNRRTLPPPEQKTFEQGWLPFDAAAGR